MSDVSDYLEAYTSLEVPYARQVLGSESNSPLGTGPFTSLLSLDVRIDQYQNTGSTRKENATPWNLDKTKIFELREIYAKWRDSTHGMYGGLNPMPSFVEPPDQTVEQIREWSIANVFGGKGAAHEIRFVLQLVIWNYYREPNGAFRWTTANDMVAYLKNYIKHIGLDCNGFVTNYINNVKKKGWKPQDVQNIGAADGKLRTLPRKDVIGITSGDVISYVYQESKPPGKTSVSHCAMVESVPAVSGASCTLRIAESIGGAGLRFSGPTEVTVSLSGFTGEGNGAPLFSLLRTGAPSGLSIKTNPALVYISAV